MDRKKRLAVSSAAASQAAAIEAMEKKKKDDAKAAKRKAAQALAAKSAKSAKSVPAKKRPRSPIDLTVDSSPPLKSRPPLPPPRKRPTIRNPSTLNPPTLGRVISDSERKEIQQQIKEGEKIFTRIYGNERIDMPWFTRSILSSALLPSSPPPSTPTPSRFTSARHYLAYYLPLFMREVIAEVGSEASEKFQRELDSRVVCVEESAVTVGRGGYGQQKKQQQAEDPSLITLKLTVPKIPQPPSNPPKTEFRQGDLLLLYGSEDHQYVRDCVLKGERLGVDKAIIVNVEVKRFTLENLIVKTSKASYQSIITTSSSLPLNNPTSLKIKTFRYAKIGNLVTPIREFNALLSLPKLPLLKAFLNPPWRKTLNTPKAPSSPNFLPTSEKSIGALALLNCAPKSAAYGNGFITHFEKNYNESQLLAISAASKGYGEDGGVTLIKGPPGTGKTTTLVGVLNSVHLRQMNVFQAGIAEIAKTLANSSMKNSEVNEKWQKAAGNKPRILVCAPSNGAVDNIIKKVMTNGFVDGKGKRYFPSMYRVGSGQSTEIKDQVSLEKAVNDIYKDAADATVMEPRIAALKLKMKATSDLINGLIARLQAIKRACPKTLKKGWEIRCMDDFDTTGRVYWINHIDKTTQLFPPKDDPVDLDSLHPGIKAEAMPEFKAHLGTLVSCSQRYDRAKTELENCEYAKGKQGHHTRLHIEANLLEQCQIVFVTLSSAGHPSLQNTRKFEVVIVDEAAQCVEPSTLIALELGSHHTVLVGDPKQLPATLFDSSGARDGRRYDRSLFERLEAGNVDVYMLNTQYRMHSEISKFPRARFYENKLLNSSRNDERTFGKSLLKAMSSSVKTLATPYVIFDLKSQEEKSGMSLINRLEADFVIDIVRALQESFGYENLRNKVGVITPYAKQVKHISRQIEAAVNEGCVPVETNTVDGFQGREKEVIIFSAVRAGKGNGIGFLSDERRMNVALTRPKSMFVLVCDVDRVRKGDSNWKALVDEAGRAGKVVRVIGSGRQEGNGKRRSFNLEDLEFSELPQVQEVEMGRAERTKEGEVSGGEGEAFPPLPEAFPPLPESYLTPVERGGEFEEGEEEEM
ncbi:hypothetical protein TrST_g2912 [Triparma strigata]|uniref:WW domain-containing protein n=1 Tax=Triparma strigata TaxID=1606541 RepID=A0A9W7BND8_9STRA|nr:hypothetical protein TrST_g2912 [Triparma strigata]